MNYILIPLNLIVSLNVNASIITLPTLDDWTSRCLNSPELNQMSRLKEFCLKDKNPIAVKIE